MIRIDVELQRGAFNAEIKLETVARFGGLFGPSGAGKTTVLLAVAGLIPVRRGRIEIGGTVLLDTAKRIDLPAHQRRLGVVFQEARLFPHLDVRRNLTFGRPSPLLSGPNFDEVVSLLDLEPLLPRDVRTLSGGQARLIAVGRALLAHPRLLLLDEPLTGLDPALRRRVLAYLLRLKANLDLRALLVSHRFSDFLALADDMAILRGGAVRETGTPAALLGPALHDRAAGGVETTLQGVVAEVNGEDAVVTCGDARLALSFPGCKRGGEAYITVAAEDVLITLDANPRTSARNALRGRVVELREAGSHWLVSVDAGAPIWAEITEASRAELGLEPGSEVTLLIKASALRGVGL